MPRSEPDLSILIPNYNYARYIGEAVRSALAQSGPNIEVVVCDNASTDDSVKVIESIGDARVRLSCNPVNVGLAANLERVAAMATGRRMLLLSSDDRIAPDGLAAYARLEQALGTRAATSVWGSSTSVIDSDGQVTRRLDADPKLWRGAVEESALSKAVGYPVRSIAPKQLLRRSLELLRMPLPFATISYPRAMHDQVGGYSGGRLTNPDKWFLWKLLAAAETVYVVDAPLFDYRIHGARQMAQEKQSGALKHLTDEYIATFSLPTEVLRAAGIEQAELARAFVEQDIALRGMVAIADGERTRARRMVHFGNAAYPQLMQRNPKVWALRTLLTLGPVGSAAARLLRQRAQTAWQKKQAK